MARALAEAGAGALVLFNRFYQPDIDVATLHLTLDLALSTPLRCGCRCLDRGPSWACEGVAGGSTGVETRPTTCSNILLAGADAVMTTSSLLRHGVSHMRTLATDWRPSRRAGY